VAKASLEKRSLTVQAVKPADMGETKLLVRREHLSVKVVVNTVMRGTVRPVTMRSLSRTASDVLVVDLELPMLSPEDIDGGKLVAAMDRQHPRDLFDVMELFTRGGITPGIRRAFVVYLASHNRTIHEVLFPAPKDITLAYDGAFAGMTTEPVALETLLATRQQLFEELPASLDANEGEFLRTLVRARPNWSLLGIAHLEELQPASAESPRRGEPGEARRDPIEEALDFRVPVRYRAPPGCTQVIPSGLFSPGISAMTEKLARSTTATLFMGLTATNARRPSGVICIPSLPPPTSIRRTSRRPTAS